MTKDDAADHAAAIATATGAGMFTQAFWDDRYGSRQKLWSGKPNPQLVAHAGEFRAGRALDVGCGEGADTIWLAQCGFLVTAVDISPVAIARGAQHAAQAGPGVADRIEWRQEDLLSWGPEPGSFDLISSQFMHLPSAPRAALFARLADGVAPGGTLLIVGHHPVDLEDSASHQAMAELRFTALEAAGRLDRNAWEILVETTAERSMTDPDGNPRTVHDAVLHARRRP